MHRVADYMPACLRVIHYPYRNSAIESLFGVSAWKIEYVCVRVVMSSECTGVFRDECMNVTLLFCMNKCCAVWMLYTRFNACAELVVAIDARARTSELAKWVPRDSYG